MTSAGERAGTAQAQKAAEGVGQGTGTALAPQDLRLFLVAGEHSGDTLGAKLMAALNSRLKGRVHYLGVGGEQMEGQGLTSQFPLSDVAVMGILSILRRLPTLINRVHRVVDAAVAADPDAIVIIDAPEFTHPIAKRVRRRLPQVPIIDYVCPSVWAWRPGRARKMLGYVDHVLALLPFEPEALAQLGGPASTYVGHPLIERLAWLDALDPSPLAKRLRLKAGKPVLVVLPGSRSSEVKRLMDPFGEAVAQLYERGIEPYVIIPVVRHVRPLIEQKIASWRVKPILIEGEEDKFRAFKLARAALAASGTVTLELAMCATPAVVAYRVDPLAARLRFLMKVPSIVLANLVLGENVYPEYIQEECTPELLSGAVELLLKDTPERSAQLKALARIPERMHLAEGTPSEAAAAVVLRLAQDAR
jgi:lipid-A-disaccharide synthase